LFSRWKVFIIGCRGCHQCDPEPGVVREIENANDGAIKVALVGNPNVGKSVLFNQLTGSHQIIGNWPGKTVDVLSGRLIYEENEFDIIDLPGTYSFSSDVGEERRVRDFLVKSRPDVVINVVDSTFLERNLALTLELLLLDIPMVVCLNQIDRAEKQGLKIDVQTLESLLGVPVMPTSGLRGIGVTDLLKVSLETVKQSRASVPSFHSGRIVNIIDSLRSKAGATIPGYPLEWIVERLLIGDEEIEKVVEKEDQELVRTARNYRSSLEREMDDNISSILTSDRFSAAGGIASKVVEYTKRSEVTREEKLHNLLTHRVYGILILAGIALLAFYSLFKIGDFFATLMIDQIDTLRSPFITSFTDQAFGQFLWDGLIGGIVSVLTIALPYLIPFFIFLAILEDTGYIARVAFVMDNILHRIGLHGKAFIPMLLGYSCNVPACMGCRILETERERILAIFAVTLIPCAATSIVIFGLVGTYVGFLWVIGLYGFNLLIIALLTRLAYSALPGEPAGLIMEMPPLRRPSFKIVIKQSWHRVKDFIYIAVPLLIVVGLFLGALDYFGLFAPIMESMSPLTEDWLGLPMFTGIMLIFGILRKELTILLLASVSGAVDLSTVMTDVQMVVFTLIVMLYIPCVATIGALIREIGAKKAAIITAFEIGFAILIGGIAFRILPSLM